jgi:hypothetical protein
LAKKPSGTSALPAAVTVSTSVEARNSSAAALSASSFSSRFASGSHALLNLSFTSRNAERTALRRSTRAPSDRWHASGASSSLPIGQASWAWRRAIASAGPAGSVHASPCPAVVMRASALASVALDVAAGSTAAVAACSSSATSATLFIASITSGTLFASARAIAACSDATRSRVTGARAAGDAMTSSCRWRAVATRSACGTASSMIAVTLAAAALGASPAFAAARTASARLLARTSAVVSAITARSVAIGRHRSPQASARSSQGMIDATITPQA